MVHYAVCNERQIFETTSKMHCTKIPEFMKEVCIGRNAINNNI